MMAKLSSGSRMAACVMALCILLTGADANAGRQEHSVDAASAQAHPIPLAPSLSVLVDESRKLTLEDVRQPAMQRSFVDAGEMARPLNYGFSQSAFWLRLTVHNDTGAALDRVVEIKYKMLSTIDFHQPLTTGGYRSTFTGAALPFSTRGVPSRYFVFPVTLPAQSSQTLYFRITSDNGIVIPATLWEPAAYRAHERNEYLLQAAYFGLAAALILYNLLLFFTLRDPVHGLYAVFATAMALSIAAVNGFAAEFLWPESVFWSSISFYVLYSLAMAAQIMFIRRTLDVDVLAPRIDAGLKLLIGVMLLLPVCLFASLATWAEPVSMVWATTGVVLLWVLLYLSLFKRQKLAALFGLAFAMLLLGGMMVELKTLDLIPQNNFTQQGLQLGSGLEMLLLAFTLAYRFNLIRREATAVVERSNADLARHLQAKEAELTAAHARLRVSDRLQTISQERQRLVQDMHDGVGSSLVTALMVVERGRLNGEEVARVLKSCIDDLKLAIDSMEPVDADLQLLLATLRFRLGPRLEDSGIQLKWRVAHVAALDWLEPGSSLHILRILQEAFANIVKHAQATEITVATAMGDDNVAITVHDNGVGFPAVPGGRPPGKGLANQRRRAQAIGATVDVVSSAAGTCLTLRLPRTAPRA